MPWFRPVVGVALTDGVSEIDAASAFEVYNVSGEARTAAITPGGSITTRHGLVLLGLPYDEASDVDRIVQPGARTPGDLDQHVTAWASSRGIPVEPMSGPHGRAGFDGALEFLGHESGAGTARSAAKMIDYPAEQLDLGPETSSPRTWLLLAGLVVVSALAGRATYVVVAGSCTPRARWARSSDEPGDMTGATRSPRSMTLEESPPATSPENARP
jgi:hypothetical protein